MILWNPPVWPVSHAGLSLLAHKVFGEAMGTAKSWLWPCVARRAKSDPAGGARESPLNLQRIYLIMLSKEIIKKLSTDWMTIFLIFGTIIIEIGKKYIFL